MSQMKLSIASTCLLLLTVCLHAVIQSAEADERSASEMLLPVSLNEVMVAMVNNSADPIWQAAWRHPESDEVWRSLERNAYQLEIAGALLAVPGTGPMDEAWTSNPKWGAFCEELEDSAAKARIAIINRDLEAIKVAGDEIVVVCEGCHIAFKLAEPTAGKYGELSPTASDFEE